MYEMKLEIWRLIKKYVQENRFPDRDYIIQLIEIIVHFRGLEDYVRPSRTEFITGSEGKTIADYSYLKEKRYIRIFWSEVEKTLKLIKANKDYNFSDLEVLLDGLFQMSESIYHEIEHAYQKRLVDRRHIDYLTKIMTRTYALGYDIVNPGNKSDYKGLDILRFYLLKLREEIGVARTVHLYNKYYTFAPEERLANVSALEVTLDILNFAKDDFSEDIMALYDFRRCRLLFELLRAYRKQPNPTEYYFSKLNLLDDEMAKLLNTKCFDTEERIRYGLYVPKNEIDLRWEEKEKIRNELKLRSQL